MVPDPSTPLALGFVVLVLLVAAAIVALVHHARGPWQRVALGLTVYLAASYALGASGILLDAVPPRSMLILLPGLVCSVWFALRSTAGEALVARAPMIALVGLHCFRLPLELLMHGWATEGALPPQMTYTGRNWDIVTGITALVVAPLAARSRVAVFVWNIVGLLLLLNIVAIAVTSLPGPLRLFMNDPPNVLVTRAPYTWLPLFLVQVAFAGHILVFRALRRRADLR